MSEPTEELGREAVPKAYKVRAFAKVVFRVLWLPFAFGSLGAIVFPFLVQFVQRHGYGGLTLNQAAGIGIGLSGLLLLGAHLDDFFSFFVKAIDKTSFGRSVILPSVYATVVVGLFAMAIFAGVLIGDVVSHIHW